MIELNILKRASINEWWGAGVVICLERYADLHTAQPMPLPLTVSCFSKIQIRFTFLVAAHPGSPGHGAVKRVCACVQNRDEAVCDVGFPGGICSDRGEGECRVTQGSWIRRRRSVTVDR